MMHPAYLESKLRKIGLFATAKQDLSALWDECLKPVRDAPGTRRGMNLFPGVASARIYAVVIDSSQASLLLPLRVSQTALGDVVMLQHEPYIVGYVI